MVASAVALVAVHAFYVRLPSIHRGLACYNVDHSRTPPGYSTCSFFVLWPQTSCLLLRIPTYPMFLGLVPLSSTPRKSIVRIAHVLLFFFFFFFSGNMTDIPGMAVSKWTALVSIFCVCSLSTTADVGVHKCYACFGSCAVVWLV